LAEIKSTVEENIIPIVSAARVTEIGVVNGASTQSNTQVER
jgi:hypothetical protein